MPDWGGGLFTAFMAAKDVGKNDDDGSGFQGEKGSPGDGGGVTPEYEQYLIDNDLHLEPDGTEAPGRDTTHVSGATGGGQQPRQGGAWGRGRGFGK